MQTIITIIALFAAVLAPQALGQAAQEYKRLQDEREKALAAAADPINKRYTTALEALLRQATQSGDLNTAVNIRAELKKFGVTPLAPVPGAGAMVPAGEAKKVLEVKLRDSRWQLEGGKKFTLNADGTTTSSWTPRHGKWKVIAPDTIELSIWNTPTPPEKATVDVTLSAITWAEIKPGKEAYVAKRVVPGDAK